MKQTELMVLKDRREQGYFIGYLVQNEIGIWCAHHHYGAGNECTQELFPSFSLAVDELIRIKGEWL